MRILTILISFGLSFCTTSQNPETAENQSQNPEMETENAPFAVVELFTSEGCSSCPPADKVLSRLVDESQTSGKNIIALSFHVDYWNRLGWADPFSRPEFSARQRTYARKMNASRVYTPQMVVNGKEEFTGSKESTARSAIEAALKEKPSVAVEISEMKWEGNDLQGNYSVSEIPENAVVNVAVVERNLSRNVTRGENRGRELKHDNVVRSFSVKDLNEKTGRFSLKIPNDLNKENASIVIYVQDENSWKVLGAKSEILKDKF